MPVWVFIALGIGLVLVLAGLGAGGYYGWRTYERRLVFKLVTQAEGLEAAAAALFDTVSRLADASDEEFEKFAEDADDEERRTLAEVRSRASILAAELDRVALPKRLIPAAEALADAATIVYRQASVVSDEDSGADALEKLAEIDLSDVRAYTHKARMILGQACESCGLDDKAVYGGGLYL